MIDKILYKFFSWIDSWFEWVEKEISKTKKKKKKRKPSNEDLFNGE